MRTESDTRDGGLLTSRPSALSWSTWLARCSTTTTTGSARWPRHELSDGDASPSQGLSLSGQAARQRNGLAQRRATVLLCPRRRTAAKPASPDVSDIRRRLANETRGRPSQQRLCEACSASAVSTRRSLASCSARPMLGAGAVKVAVVDGRVTIEHVPPGELLVDARDAARGSPRSLPANAG